MNEPNDLPPHLMLLESQIASLESRNVVPPVFNVSRFLEKLKTIDGSLDQVQTPADEPAVADANEGAEDRLGERLGDYELIEVIGRGGAGTVYRARHVLLHRELAIKVLRRSGRGDLVSTDDPVIRRFLREIKVIGNIHSPHVVAATDARVDGDALILVMELVDGVTLRRHLRKHGTPAVDQARQWIRQACLGLHAAHETGVVHRDIKPSNLMITTEGNIKILDLGLASLRHCPVTESNDDKDPSLTSPSSIVGTIDYISPEQIEDARLADARSDIYSLGCVFYFLLTGKPPFNAEDYPTDVARLMAHVSVVPKPVRAHRADVPQDVCDVVSRMLAKSPNARFESILELAEHI